ncbi:hypothetical protein L596_030657 [Steinernema carpocapsae]|uniref:Uncharacterized protein n=1 Tax=Steinernema carpocapsae TaxID=34508 RepID=A0A4U5LQ31_STECR|nr:hypothetical protein L596_030657 [Steinernema carpocapsae]
MERFRVDFTAFFVALFGLYAVTGYKTCVPSALQGYHIVSAKENAVFYFNIEQNKDKDLEGIYMQIKMDHEFISIESDKIKGVRLYLGYGNHIYVLHKISDGEKQFGLLYRTKITFDNETGIQKLINGSKIPFTDIENSFFWNDAIYFSSGSVTIKSKKYVVINAPDRAYKENIVYDIATGASYNDAVFGINSRQIVRQNCSENKKTPYCFMLASDGKKCHLINSSVLHDVILVPTSPVKKSTMLISSSITTTTTSSTTSTIMTTTSTQKSSSSTSAKASTLRTSPATSETKPKDEPPKTAMKQEATEDQKPGKSRLLPIILLLLAVLFLGALVVAMVSCVKYRHARHYMKDTRRIRKAKKRTTKTITGSVSNPSPQTESSLLSSHVATV